MKCPVCSTEMVQKDFGADVDVCANGCKGIWFDQHELRKLDEKNEGLGNALEEALRYPRNNAGSRGQIACPKCSMPMQTHKYRNAQEVNVDECYGCGGFFVDSGELTEMRDYQMSDAQVTAYIDNLTNAIPEYAQAAKDLNAKQERVESIQKFTKFLTVSYWRKKFVPS